MLIVMLWGSTDIYMLDVGMQILNPNLTSKYSNAI